LAELLEDNYTLRTLAIKSREQFPVNLSFLARARQLTGFRFLSQFTVTNNDLESLYPEVVDPLFEFIGTHPTLTSLTLKVLGRYSTMTQSNFKDFYTRLVDAILEGNSVIDLKLAFNIIVAGDKGRFIEWFGSASIPLVGRGITLNGVELDQMVVDFSTFSMSNGQLTEDNIVNLGWTMY